MVQMVAIHHIVVPQITATERLVSVVTQLAHVLLVILQIQLTAVDTPTGIVLGQTM
jgi:hypothetical protein